jgi:hypothetical protein
MPKDANGVVIAVGDHVTVSAKIVMVPSDDADVASLTMLIVATDTGVVGTNLVVEASSVVKS